MGKIILGACCLLVMSISNAQTGPFGYYRDALFFGQTNSLIGNSARMQAIGGASVSLGGDISCITSNPGGLGFFNRNVFSFTPSIDFITTDTEYIGIRDESLKNNFNFSNIGTVINFTKGEYTNDRFKGGSLGISLTRKNSYHRNRDYEARNPNNSIIDSFIESAGTVLPEDLSGLSEGAFDQYLISPTFDDNDVLNGYDSFVLGFPVQSESIKESGSHYNLNVAWGGNYDDRLYFGGGMGIQILNYKQERNYAESNLLHKEGGNDVEDENLEGLHITDTLIVKGKGINFNLGMIYRPVNFITVGVSYTTPTFVSLKDKSFFDVDADWRDGSQFIDDTEMVDLNTIDPFQSDLFKSGYNLRAPSRLSVGASFIFGKLGFIATDIEFVDFSNAKIKSNDFLESADNDVINELYTSVVNVKVGGELRLDHFRLRAGYALFPSAIQNSSKEDLSNITLGFGYRTKDYFLDFALVQSKQSASYSPYRLSMNQPIANTDIKTTSVSVTFGLVF